MSKPLVRYVIDLANPPPLTTRQQAELALLKAMPDEDIDTTDIPPLTEGFWRKAKRNPFCDPAKAAPKKRAGTVRRRPEK